MGIILMKIAVLNNEPEVVYSIQGEGISMGFPSIFVRLSNCNLHCIWCDTPYTWNWEKTNFKHPEKAIRSDSQGEISIDLLVREITKHPCLRVIFTGGEPMIQQKDLVKVMSNLRNNNSDYYFEIETNATFTPSTQLRQLVNQFNLSPKLSNCGDSEHLRLKPKALSFFSSLSNTSFKFVIETEQDLKEVEHIKNEYKIHPSKILLMPQARTSESLKEAQERLITICKTKGFRYTDRLHVRIYGNKKGV